MNKIDLDSAGQMTRREWVEACHQYIRAYCKNQKDFIDKAGISKKCFQDFRKEKDCFYSTVLRIVYFIGGMSALLDFIPYSSKTLRGKICIYMAIGNYNQSDIGRQAGVPFEIVSLVLSDEWVSAAEKAKIMSVVKRPCAIALLKHIYGE